MNKHSRFQVDTSAVYKLAQRAGVLHAQALLATSDGITLSEIAQDVMRDIGDSMTVLAMRDKPQIVVDIIDALDENELVS